MALRQFPYIADCVNARGWASRGSGGDVRSETHLIVIYHKQHKRQGEAKDKVDYLTMVWNEMKGDDDSIALSYMKVNINSGV